MVNEAVYSESMRVLREWGYDYETAHEIAYKRAQRAAASES